tara:strand:+ start:10746 stop:11087 length:342 start_codon:yes stop_codon:yes gene_type:complete
MIQIYHNPRCGKSRNALALVEETTQEFEVIKYLEQTPSYDDLVLLLKKLDLKPLELVRQKEKIWVENFKNKTMSDENIIKAMVSNPILIERPIIIKGDKAIIGRDLEKITHFL